MNRWIDLSGAPPLLIPATQAHAWFGATDRVTGEYSYRSRHCASDGLLLAGDAFAFLDPVFSSGVCLALYSGEAAGHAVDSALADADFSAARFEEYGRLLCQSIESMRALVYTFYDHEFSFRKFIDKYPHLSPDMTDCLIGNLLRDYEPLQTAMQTFARLPAHLDYGKPLLDASLVKAR